MLHGIVDKLIGDEVMGLYFPPLTLDGRYVDAMVSDARELLRAVGYGTTEGRVSRSEWVSTSVRRSSVGEGEVRDFTALGDVVNTAARLQSAAQGGQIVMSAEVARIAGVDEGEVVDLEVKGKAERVAARVVSVR